MSKPDYFNRQNLVLGPETGEKITSTSILVIGAGAGGNELLKNLVLMGFGHITVVDFDLIEDSNLSRTILFRKEDTGESKALTAARRLNEIALHNEPCIAGIHGNIIYDIGPGIFLKHDIIVSCVDNLAARAWINDWCVTFKKPFFEMGFDGLNADVCFMDPTVENAPCLREIIGQGDFDSKRNSCSGLKINDTHLLHIPTIQIISAMAGVLVATEIIKFMQGKSSVRNKMLQYHGASQCMNIYGIDRNSSCQIHNEPELKYRHIHAGAGTLVGDFLEMVNAEFSMYCMVLLADRFVLDGNCEGCGKKLVYNQAFNRMHDEQRWCPDCRDSSESNFKGNWNMVSSLHIKMKDTGILNKGLSDLGVPPMAILGLVGIRNDQVHSYNILID